jgi:dynein heavy chain
MDPNCAITCAQSDSFELLQGLLAVSAKGAKAGKGKSREDIMDETAETMQHKTPKRFEIDVIEVNYPTMYEESLNTVLKQEALRVNRLAAVMVVTLKEFRKAIRGLVVMSAELDTLGVEMFNNQVPEAWASKGFLSLKPLSTWVNDFNDRRVFFSGVVRRRHSDRLLGLRLLLPAGFLDGRAPELRAQVQDPHRHYLDAARSVR